jgi:hypothetical protein
MYIKGELTMKELTVDRLRELLDYNPETGEFVWKVGRKGTKGKGSIAGNINKDTGYIHIGIDGKRYKAHRLAWYHHFGEWPRLEISHLDNVKVNNSITNLKDTNHSDNKHNDSAVRSDKTSELPRGVYPSGKGFKAQISLNGKEEYLGTFQTIAEASQAYISRKQEILAARK